MKITFYGTAAAEAMPALYCYCDHCERARKAGGRNIRTRSQALVNDDLLIDMPPDTYMHVINYGLDLRGIYQVLITHCHEDHLYPLEFCNLGIPFAHRKPDAEQVQIYISEKSSPVLVETLEKAKIAGDEAQHHIVKAFEPFEAGRYTVTPLLANHAMKLDPLIYVISDGEKTMLYGNDTGWFLPETWEYIEKNKIHFDFVSLDCTCTCDEIPYANNHMNLLTCANTKKKMLEIGCADENTVFCLHHFSHNGGYTYDELVPVAAELGFLVSYDSMEYEF